MEQQLLPPSRPNKKYIDEMMRGQVENASGKSGGARVALPSDQ
jgi:hypothetical protein